MPKDPYKYFRVEAREILDGLSQGVMEIEKGAIDKGVFSRLLRLAHTLKGAARVVKQPGIAELAHGLEGALAPYREGQSAMPRDETSRMLQIVDAIGTKIAELDRPVEKVIAPSVLAPAAPPSPPTDEPFKTVRVDVEEMDALLEGISRIGTQLTALRRQLDVVDRARRIADVLSEEASVFHAGAQRQVLGKFSARSNAAAELRQLLGQSTRTLTASVEQATVELTQVRDLSNELRLLPASSIFGLLERAIRDAAQLQHKKVDFTADGGDTRMDAHVLAAIRDALLHVVRNAVAHGIETEAERISAGKRAAGSVSLHVERRGNRVALVCKDDGRGIDVEAIRRVAIRRGLLSTAKAESLNLEQVVQLILRGGLTTTSTVNELSGRGIGLDVVRDTVSGLKGDLRLESESGRGTTVEICVPVSLSSLAALVVESAGTAAAIPLDSVRQTMRIGESEIVRSVDGYSISYSGTVIPFQPLAGILNRAAASGGKKNLWTTVVVIQSGDNLAAIGVDRLQGTANVVARSLPVPVESEPVVAGVSLDADGNPQLLLDPKGLVEAVRQSGPQESERHAAPHRPVLVIDDSLTTRMLEQSILTSAGFEVELASSAEEAIDKARERPFSLFVVDVEMPGMDGFEFVERTRADPVLREIPAILVTSRNSPEDRLRGKQAGAKAYIVKSEFDQGFLLNTIRNLIG